MFRSKTNNIDALKNFIYLFLIDVSTSDRRHYTSYQTSEPGYANAWLSAYVEIFKEPKTGEITHDRLLKIHRLAMAHKPDTNPGCYKTCDNNYDVCDQLWPEVPLQNTTYNVNKEGLIEFIQEWLVKPPLAPIHMISFEKSNLNERGYILSSVESGLVLSTWENCKTIAQQKINLNNIDHKNFLFSLLKSNEFRINISSMPEVDHSKIETTVREHLDYVIDKFKKTMLTATTDKEKINSIMTHVQKISQIHPFIDGNIRTCYILINLLLRDYNLAPTLLLNANRLDCCSRSNLQEMLILGQGFCAKLIANENDTLVLHTTESLPDSRQLSFNQQTMPDVSNDLLTQFCEQVLRVNNAPTLAAPNFGLFDKTEPAKVLLAIVTKKIGHIEKYTSLLEAVKNHDMELALRKACADNLFDIVREILVLKEKLNIDVDKPSKNGNTALNWLLESPAKEGKNEIIALLKNQGAKTKAELVQSKPT